MINGIFFEVALINKIYIFTEKYNLTDQEGDSMLG